MLTASSNSCIFKWCRQSSPITRGNKHWCDFDICQDQIARDIQTPLQLRWIKLEKQLWPLKSTSTQLTFLDNSILDHFFSCHFPGRVPSCNPFVPRGCFALRRSTGWVQRVVWAKRWTRSEGFRLFRPIQTGFRVEMRSHSESKNVKEKETLKPIIGAMTIRNTGAQCFLSLLFL